MFGDQQAYFEPWLQFKHPAIRQLAFSLASPNILKSLPQELIIKHHLICIVTISGKNISKPIYPV